MSLQQVVQFLRPPQHPGPLPLGGDGAGGAAQVQVDLPVAHPGQLTCRPEKVRPAPGEQLGHRIQVPVLLRQDVPQLPAGEHVVLAGGEKGHEIPVHPREEPAVGPAEQGSCDPLHGGEKAAHSLQLQTRRSQQGLSISLIRAGADRVEVLQQKLCLSGGDGVLKHGLIAAAHSLSHAPRTHVPANHGAVLGEFTLKAADDLRKIRLIRTKAGGAEEKDLLACQ